MFWKEVKKVTLEDMWTCQRFGVLKLLCVVADIAFVSNALLSSTW